MGAEIMATIIGAVRQWVIIPTHQKKRVILFHGETHALRGTLLGVMLQAGMPTPQNPSKLAAVFRQK